MILRGNMSKEVKYSRGLTPEGEQAAARIRALFEEGKKRLEAMTFPCPVDGKSGSYTGDVGSFQIVVPVFQCPDGHKFSVRIDSNNATKLLPNQGWTPSSGEAK